MKIEHQSRTEPNLVIQSGHALLVESNGRNKLIDETEKDLTMAEEWESMFAPGIVVTKPENIREFSWL